MSSKRPREKYIVYYKSRDGAVTVRLETDATDARDALRRGDRKVKASSRGLLPISVKREKEVDRVIVPTP
jgi:hypothetical protein